MDTTMNTAADSLLTVVDSRITAESHPVADTHPVADPHALAEPQAIADPQEVIDHQQIAEAQTTAESNRADGPHPADNLQSVASPQVVAGFQSVTETHESDDDRVPVQINKRKLEDDDEYHPSAPGTTKRHQPAVVLDIFGRAVSVVASTGGIAFGIHAGKPEPYGNPPAWSEKRAAMNDAVPYFKAHQGGIYSNNHLPHGMLIDSQVGDRDFFSSQVIITSVGSGRVLDKNTKKMVYTEDQDSKAKNIKCLTKARDENRCFVMIAGAGNKNFPVVPSHYYNVLDYFYVTDIWLELVDGGLGELVKAYMVRLEKVNLASKSWWAPSNASSHDAGEYEVGEYLCASKVCKSCQISSKEIYKQGWACLNKDCSHFFEFSRHINYGELRYANDFLRERTKYTGEEAPRPLTPPLPASKGDESGCESRFKQGIVCPQCNACSRRIYWHGWACENPECDFTHIVELSMISAEQVAIESETFRKKSARHNFAHQTVKVSVMQAGCYEIVTYALPDENGDYIGTVSKVSMVGDALDRSGGINDLYQALQKEDLGLQRRPARNAGGKPEELTSHFSVNFGAKYKFGVVVKESTSFRDAPSSIMETVTRLIWAGRTAVKHTTDFIEKEDIAVPDGAIPSEFNLYNELLCLGYFEKSKISPHDDGEKELGPNVASLSLGSPAVMKFMPKRGVILGDDDHKIGSETKVGKPILSFVLEHGDMMVMHGEKIQKLYLHSVDPYGKHRFALTCRYIRPETIPNREESERAVVDGKIPDEWAAIRYNGEADRFESCATGEVIECPKATVKNGAGH